MEEITALAYFVRTISSGLDDAFRGSPDMALEWARRTVKESSNRSCHVNLPGKTVQRDKAGRVVIKKSKFY
jgi:hypothetical protein